MRSLIRFAALTLGVALCGCGETDGLLEGQDSAEALQLGTTLQGESHSLASAGIEEVQGGVGHLDAGGYYCWNDVSLQGITSMTLRIASMNVGGVAEIREGGLDGSALGKVTVTAPSATWFSYANESRNIAPISTAPTQLCVVGLTGEGIFNLDSLKLNGGGATANVFSATGVGSPTGKGLALRPNLLGQNFWYADNVERLWPRIKNSGIKLVRIGGIDFDNNNISPQQYLDWVDQIRAIGAEPVVQVSRHRSADAAAEMVRFINVQSRRNVRRWSIGNEPNLPGDVAEVARYVRGHAVAMRDVDRDILIYAPDGAHLEQASYEKLIGGDQDITGRDGKGRFFIDGVTFHSYPFGHREYSRTEAVAAGRRIENTVGRLMELLEVADDKHGRTGARALRWGIGEFNITFLNFGRNGVEDQGAHSFLNGQHHAHVYSLGMASGADFVASWSVHQDGGSRVPKDLGYLDGPLSNPTPRSSYYHTQLLSQYFSGRHAKGTVNQPNVRAFGAGDGTRLAVMIMNMNRGTGYDFVVRLDGRAPTRGELRVGIDSGLDVERAGHIQPEATAVLVFNKEGRLVRRVDYDVDRARAEAAPAVRDF
jgi:hypothetical protein